MSQVNEILLSEIEDSLEGHTEELLNNILPPNKPIAMSEKNHLQKGEKPWNPLDLVDLISESSSNQSTKKSAEAVTNVPLTPQSSKEMKTTPQNLEQRAKIQKFKKKARIKKPQSRKVFGLQFKNKQERRLLKSPAKVQKLKRVRQRSLVEWLKEFQK